MRRTCEELSNSLEVLRAQLRVAGALRALPHLDLLGPPRAEHAAIYSVLQSLQRFDVGRVAQATYYYNATIVSLYGLLERFIEDLVIQSVQLVAKAAPTTKQLPSAMRENHLNLTLDVLVAAAAGRYRGATDTVQLVRTLDRNLRGLPGTHINDEVFTRHSANFRSEVIRQSFERLGFSPHAQVRADEVYQAVLQQHFPDEENAYFVIDDLAERRNEVAHGSSPQQLLDAQFLLAYIDVVEAYLLALGRAAAGWVTNLAVVHVGVALRRPDAVYSAGWIAGFRALPARVRVNDVLAVVSNRAARCVRVDSIEVSRRPYRSAAVGSSVGLKLTAPVSRRARLFRMPAWADELIMPT